MKLELVKFPDDILTTSCVDITEITDEIRELARSMIRMMYEWEGVGLAAPQVGFNIRMCVIDTMATMNDFMSAPIVMITSFGKTVYRRSRSYFSGVMYRRSSHANLF